MGAWHRPTALHREIRSEAPRERVRRDRQAGTVGNGERIHRASAALCGPCGGKTRTPGSSGDQRRGNAISFRIAHSPHAHRDRSQSHAAVEQGLADSRNRETHHPTARNKNPRRKKFSFNLRRRASGFILSSLKCVPGRFSFLLAPRSSRFFLLLIESVNRKSLASWGRATGDFVTLLPLL